MSDRAAPLTALRSRILEEVRGLVDRTPAPEFEPGKTQVQFAGRVFDADEYVAMTDAVLDGWLTAGRFTEEFEASLASFLGIRTATMVNSGSSANLVAVSALTSRSLGERRLSAGDEVVTVASGFPSTVAPIVQNRLVPVFVDVEIGTYNIKVSDLERAVSPRTKAVVLAHTLGNPFDIDAVTAFAEAHHLWLVEDACDALGSAYRGRPVGTVGDFATVSFYPAHHITTGEGGAVVTDDLRLERIARSFRDWGRDCYCETGVSDSCGERFTQQFGHLPFGYDHKYVYTHLGYNLKATDIQAAAGAAQIKKLPLFVRRRKENFLRLYNGLSKWRGSLTLPDCTPGSDPAWFAFPITVRSEAHFTRAQLVAHLERRRIATRMLFGGNLTKQPAFNDVTYRTIGSLENTDLVMNQTFFVGVYPGLTNDMIDYCLAAFDDFLLAHE